MWSDSRRAARRLAAHSVAGVVLALASVSAVAQDSAATPAAAKSASGGVYTDAQARRGENSYKTNCVSCHSAKEYTGSAFTVAWVSRTAFDLFEQIRTLMPEDNPGILPRQDYVDIVAYLFSMNSYPTGADELPNDDDALKRIRIDSLPGGSTPPAPHGHWSAAQLRVRRQR
jgi:mono/diheme cytochrome c family protein